MKKITLIIFMLTCFAFQLVNAQDYKSEYIEIYQKKNDTLLFAFLNKWKGLAPKDPEMFIAFFNYYLDKGKVSGLKIENNNQGQYMTDGVTYDQENFKMAIESIDQGIIEHPNRLDMPLGKISAYSDMSNYEEQKKQLIKIIDLSNLNHNAWLWTNNKPLKNPEQVLYRVIQEYESNMFNEDQENLDRIIEISKKFLESHPNDIIHLNMLGVCYQQKNDYEKALNYLRQAEKIDAADITVLLNIAISLDKNNDIASAIDYYKKVEKSEHEAEAEYARDRLKEISK